MTAATRERLARLAPSRWPVLIEAASAVLMARVLLDHRPYKWCDTLFESWTEKLRRKEAPAEGEWERVVWAIRAVGRRTLGDRPCLPEALAGRLMLQRRGYEANLTIGVRKDEKGALLAHAWLESGQHIVLGGGESPARFKKLVAVGPEEAGRGNAAPTS